MLSILLAISLSFSLSPQQQSALEAADNHLLYGVEIVEITVNGIPREVVLLGESHRKTTAAGELGKKVINQFKYRGIEMPPLNDLDHSYLQAALMGFAVVVDRSISKVKGLFGYKKGATSILDAMYRGFFISQENQIIYNGYLIGDLRSDGFYYDHNRVRNLIPQLPKDKVADFFTQLKTHADRNLNARSTVDRTFLDVKGINPFPSHAKMVHNEYIESITIGVEFGELNNFDSRNERMTKNILAFLSQYPEATEMLVVMGGLHVSGVRKLLLSH